MRIKSTLELEYIQGSESLLGELEERDVVETLCAGEEMRMNVKGAHGPIAQGPTALGSVGLWTQGPRAHVSRTVGAVHSNFQISHLDTLQWGVQQDYTKRVHDGCTRRVQKAQ